jgi:hypothetical protein
MSTTRRSITALAVAAFLLGRAEDAVAQKVFDIAWSDAETWSRPPVERGVELEIAGGFSQGLGGLVGDVSGAGGAIEIGGGYRIDPRLMIGVNAIGAKYTHGARDASATSYAAALGLEVDWHGRPERFIDPWLGVGAGARGHWIATDSGRTSRYGVDLVRLQAGIDYRVARTVALGPVLGFELTTFLTEKTPAQTQFSRVSQPAVTSFVFLGVLARFDIPTR